MKQVFNKLHFNLRQRNTDKPTIIYCVIRIDKKVYKVATGVKVKPQQWDSSRQIAVISNIHSQIDNRNNKIANNKISQLTDRYLEYLNYLCSSEIEDINIDTLLATLGSMRIKAGDLITRGFNYLYPQPQQDNNNNRVTSRKVYTYLLASFTDYLREQNITSLEVFKQAGINTYKRYLLDKGNSNVQTNRKVELIARLINRVLAVEEPFLKYNVKGGIVVNKEKDNRKDKGRFALTVNEVEAIEGLQIDSNNKYSYDKIVHSGEVLKEYRDIFVFQCRIGQRVSDLAQILKYITTGSDRVNQIVVDDIVYFEVKTKKSQGKETALIQIDDKIQAFIDKYSKTGFKIDIDSLDRSLRYNNAIRQIGQLAGIDREITYRNAQDKEVTEPAYKKLSSHCARHTFITIKLNEGISPDRLCYLTGHSNRQMIDTIYSHLTSSDKVKMIQEVIGKTGKGKERNSRVKDSIVVEPIDYDKVLGIVERNYNRKEELIKYLTDNKISVEAVIGYYQRLNPDSTLKKGDIVVRFDKMLERLMKLKELIERQ